MQQIFHSIVGPAGPETADLNGRVAIVTGGAWGMYLQATPAQAYELAQVSATRFPALRTYGMPCHHGES